MSVSPSSSIDDKWDINQLNEESRKFAQYFASILIISSNLLVNNYEVQMIKKNYNYLAKYFSISHLIKAIWIMDQNSLHSNSSEC